MKESTRKHGGHNAGEVSSLSAGGGPVFEVRTGLSLTQKAMATKLGASVSGVRLWEKNSTWPGLEVWKRELRKLAKQAGVDLSEWE